MFPFNKMVRGRKSPAPRTTNIMGSYKYVPTIQHFKAMRFEDWISFQIVPCSFRLNPKTRDDICMGGEVNKQVAMAAKSCARRGRRRNWIMRSLTKTL